MWRGLVVVAYGRGEREEEEMQVGTLDAIVLADVFVQRVFLVRARKAAHDACTRRWHDGT
jgi:hypothetical protein